MPKIRVEGGTKIHAHHCASAFQDRLYGSGQRLMNIRPGKGLRCTICGGIVDLAFSAPPVKSEEPKPDTKQAGQPSKRQAN